jgi:hypothetical protein
MVEAPKGKPKINEQVFEKNLMNKLRASHMHICFYFYYIYTQSICFQKKRYSFRDLLVTSMRCCDRISARVPDMQAHPPSGVARVLHVGVIQHHGNAG